MKGGFGKFLTFILGLVVGVLLVGGTIAGVVYYAVAAVSVNDVENYTKQEFTFIDKDAEIRNKSILDIYDMVKGGNIKETTVSDAKRIFGIDIIKILENSLEITVDDKSRETLGALKVADVFKDDNLKVVLNCFTLGDVLKRRVSIRPRDLQASRLCRNIFRSLSSTDSTRCLNHWNSTK